MPKSRLVWSPALPLLAILVLAAGWSAFWYIALENAKQRFASAQARAEAAGRELACRDAVWGGYPFRIELDCASTRLVLAADRGTTEIETGAVTAVALIYKPRHVIAEAHGPVAIRRGGEGAVEATFATSDAPLRVSLILGDDARPQQVSLLAENVEGTFTMGDAANAEALSGDFTAERINLHMRTLDDGNGDNPLDVVARIDNAVARSPEFERLQLGEQELRIDTAQLDGRATRFPFEPGLSFSQRARRWQAGGGRLHVNLFRIDTNLIGTSSQGEVVLDEEGRLEGDLTTAVRGFDEFLARLRTARLLTEEQALAAEAILIVLGKASGDPNDPALEIETDLKMGRFYFGPFKIAQLPPLF